MSQPRNHLRMEVTDEQFRKVVKIFSDETRASITKFRHLPDREQDTLINDLDMCTLYVCMYLKQLQKRFKYERSNTSVAKRYESGTIDGSEKESTK